MKCPKCGAVLSDNAERCSFCGEKVVPVVSFEKPIIENRPRDEAFDVENTVRKEEPVQKAPDQSPLIIAVILLSGLVFAAVAVLLFYAVQDNQRAVVTVVTTTSLNEDVIETSPSATVQEIPENTSVDIKEKTKEVDSGVRVETEAAVQEETTEPSAEGGSVSLVQTSVNDDREYGGIVYRITDNQAYLLKCYSSDSWIELPSKVFNVPVVGVSEDAFNGCTHLTHIDLPEGIAWIGANAFNGCSKLKEIVMPDTLVTVGDGCFNNCPSFTVVSHDHAYGHNFAEYHGLNWLEGDFLVPVD